VRRPPVMTAATTPAICACRRPAANAPIARRVSSASESAGKSTYLLILGSGRLPLSRIYGVRPATRLITPHADGLDHEASHRASQRRYPQFH